MLHVILLESALELVPSKISSQKQIQQHAQKRKKKPIELLLDQNYHGHAMLKLDQHERRGRPDIVYLCLMTLLESPLCKQGELRVLVHLQDGRMIEFDPSVRLPRNYERFTGLFEQILLFGQVPLEGKPLVKIAGYTLSEYIQSLPDDSKTYLALEGGEKTSPQKLLSLLQSIDLDVDIVFGVGAFPHGNISKSIAEMFKTHLEMDPEIMMAWHVCAEILWIYSQRVQTVEKRYAS